MPAPKGSTNKCPNCGMNLLQVDRVISVDGACTDNLYIYQMIRGHCKICGAKLKWKSSYLHWENSEIVVEEL